MGITASRRIGIVTGGRSDYGILRPLIRALTDEPAVEPMLFVTGMHLSPTFGHTVAEIEADGFAITARIDCLTGTDDRASMARSTGIALTGFAAALERDRPDLLVLLGDRYETFAAAGAAVLLNIPIVHIHGGEVTAGAVDEQLRHAITKMSHIHLASTETYAARIRQMGEEDWRVHAIGAPGLDAIMAAPILDWKALAANLDLDATRPFILCTYHPVTLAADGGAFEFEALSEVLLGCGHQVVLTGPNADRGHTAIRAGLDRLRAHADLHIVETLGPQYLSAMAHAAAMIGNSSSGIIEAAAYKLPVVNVGSRQDGRIRPPNVLDAGSLRDSIAAALAKALSDEFRQSLAGMVNPYGDGRAVERIIDVLKTVEIGPRLLQKKFVDREAV